MADIPLGTPRLTKLSENMIALAMQAYREGLPAEGLEPTYKDRTPTLSSGTYETSPNTSLGFVDDSNALPGSIVTCTPSNNPDRHHILFWFADRLCSEVENQLLEGPKDTLLELHKALACSAFLLREAVTISPAPFEIKIQYLSLLGHVVVLWIALLSRPWPANDVLDLLDKLKAEAADGTAKKITGFVSEIIMVTLLSTAFSVTQATSYRDEGTRVYRHIQRSMREALPLNAIAVPLSSMDMPTQQEAGKFIIHGVFSFVVRVIALLKQRLVEIELSFVVGRPATDSNFHERGVDWLDQCLMLVWAQRKHHASIPLDTTRLSDAQVESEVRILLAFIGLLLHVDINVANDGLTIAHPEQIAYLLAEEWSKLRKSYGNPISKGPLNSFPFSHILDAPRTAPVVMLYLWGSQCSALVFLGEGKFKSISLQDVTEDFAAKLQSNFKTLSTHFPCSRGSIAVPRVPSIYKVLATLWDKVVKPILNEMKLEPVESTTLDPPRLVWCLTGPTAFFPLHAAGLYASQEIGTKTYEYVASSYTPTLSILADAEIALSGNAEPFKGVLAVSLPYIDGYPPIPKTEAEVKALIEAAKGNRDDIVVQWLNGEQATKEAVLSGMESCTWLHLACHARQDSRNTSESGFMLTNGETLSLADISAHSSAGGELAFLSACQTAAGDFGLFEEGVHLAAGMLVAGYPSVIATLWAVRDEDAPVVAEAVYRRLLDGGKVNRTGAALALHHATRLLREKVTEREIVRWAPFIHLGV